MEREHTDWVNGKGVNFVLCLNPQIQNFCLKWSWVLSRSIWGINPIKLFCLPVVFESVPCHSPYNTDQVGWGGALLERKFLQLIRKCFCDIFPPGDIFPQVTLQDQQRETSLLAKRLGLAAKENQDLAEWVSLPNIVFETICFTT